MNNTSKLVLLAAVQLGLVGCTSVPSTEELQQMDEEALRSAIVGNTITQKTEYGRWVEYVESDDAGYGKASGSWGSENATASYTFNDAGEFCRTYSGPHDWSQPGNELCEIMYTDVDGNFYWETTMNTTKPHQVGETSKLEIKAGDASGLSE